MTGDEIKKMADGYPPISIGMDHEEVVVWLAKHSIQLHEQVRELAADNSVLKNTVEQCKEFFKAWVLNRISPYNGAYLNALCAHATEETPATDAALSEIRVHARAEGIHFAANRLLAAWESGFVDDTPAAAHDISGAILSAVEFLPNADEAEFRRDYADEVRARIRAGEKL